MLCILGSHAAMTCHIAVMRHRISGVVSIGHFDNFCCWQFGENSSAHRDGLDIMVRGHLQTMWTVFWGFLTPPPPLWTNVDILGTPLPVHVDFSMTPLHFISKKIFKVPIYWKFKIQTYYKLFVEYLTHPLLANS